MTHTSSTCRRLGLAAGALALVVSGWLLTHPRGSSHSQTPSTLAPVREDDGKAHAPQPEGGVAAVAPAAGSRSEKSAPPHSAPAVPRGESTPLTRELVAAVTTLDMSGGALTREGADAWNASFERLVQAGAAAVPAIREYLEAFADVPFGTSGLQRLGHASARGALFDALTRIGGPEAIALTLDILGSTAEPAEIALLAGNLEMLAPQESKWREEVMAAARKALEQAADEKPDAQDVAPLFEVLNRFGGDSVVPDLEEASTNWNYYAAMALAELPEGAGVPSLVQMAQEKKGIIPLQMLAQLAPENADARAALLEQANANEIPASAWPYLQAVLEGKRFHFADSVFDASADAASLNGMNIVHIANGNQNYYMATDATRLSPEHIDQQIALVNELAAVAQGSAAIEALGSTRAALDQARVEAEESLALRIVTP